METKIYVKPASKDLIVRDPATLRALKAEGEYKPKNTYWLRRLKDKDVVEATPAPATKKTSTAS